MADEHAAASSPPPNTALPDLSGFPGGPYKPVNLPGSVKGNVDLCTVAKDCHDSTGDEVVTVLATDGANAIVKVKDGLLVTMVDGVIVTCKDGDEALPFHLQHPDACSR